MPFYRRTTDGRRIPASLAGSYAGPASAACWILGGGPSLGKLPIDLIQSTPVPKFSINLAGTGLIRPQFWTSYDPTERFHRSIYLDPGITKFVHECRAMDLVPETTFKVCDCPSTYLFERNRETGFADFPSTGESITDWQDSLVQAIEIAYRLGFRELYLAGCEMFVAPSTRLLCEVGQRNIVYEPRMLLGDFFKRCRDAGWTEEQLEQLSTAPQYHFDESKSLQAAIATDFHYFRVSQYLRLSRRSMALAGLKLVSATPGSRLNDDFPWEPVEATCERLAQQNGDPRSESARQRYSGKLDRRPRGLGPMRDFRPHFWPAPSAPPSPKQQQENQEPPPAHKRAIENLPEIPVELDEAG